MSALFFRNEVIIYEILKVLKDNEVYERSLYSCLYINSYWCRLTVPFLWKIPFLKETETKHNKIITTYISCLKSSFSDWLNDEELSILHSEDSLINIPPLFEYEKYLKEISFKSLNKAVNKWFEETVYGVVEDSRKDRFIRKLELYLFKMFAEKSVNLESISIEFDVDSCWNIFEGERTKISNIKSLSLSFPSLKDDVSNTKELLGKLKMIQNLEEVYFLVDETSVNNDLIVQSSKEIISFVECQKNLRGFNLVGGEDRHLDAREIISSALKRHSSTLMFLNIDNVDFSGMLFSHFEKCSNLQSLGMGFCIGLSNIEPRNKFKNLKKLELSLNQFSSKFTPSILEKAGENLTELDIDDIPDDVKDVLVTHCNKIESLSISGKNQLESILPLLSKLKNLKRLEFMQVTECEVTEIENLLPKSKIKKIICELFNHEKFDDFYEYTKDLDFSLMSIIFSCDIKDFENVKYEDPESSLEINVNKSEGPGQSQDDDYKHITIKKKRSDNVLKLCNLLKSLEV